MLLSSSLEVEVEVEVVTDRQSDRRSGSHPELMTIFLFLSGNCGFLDVGRPLRREDASVIYSYNYFWALAERSLSGPSPTEPAATFYCIIGTSPPGGPGPLQGTG
jgi:hypothetical protein